MKSLLLYAGAISGFSTTTLLLSALGVELVATLFFALIMALFGSLAFAGLYENERQKELARMKDRRKYQTYKIV